jgi:hypothetical protein
MCPSDDLSYRSHLTRLFKQLFDWHPAHVCMLDLDGKILAVNRSWSRFAEGNGLSPQYKFDGQSYLDICSVAAEKGDDYAKQALTGLLDIMATGRRKFVLTYPCHAPHEKRWFKLWIEPQMPEAPVIIVAHQLDRAETISLPDMTHLFSQPGQG